MVTTSFHQIIVDIGGTLPDTMTEKLIDVEIDTSLGMASAFMIRFHDDKMTLMADSRFALGAAVTLKTKSADSAHPQETILEGEITSLEPVFTTSDGIIFVIRGYDKTHRLTRGTKRKVFKNASHSDIVSEIAGDYGMQVNVQATTPVYDHVFQDEISDRDFIERLAQLNGYRIDFKDGKIQFNKPQGDDTVSLAWQDDIFYFRPRMNLAGIVNKVVVSGWDPVAKQAITGEASSSTFQPQIGDSANGISKAGSLGASTFNAYIPDVKDASAAGKFAQSILDKFSGGFIEAEGSAYSVPQLIAGKKLEITGAGTKFSGTYLITSALHYYDKGSYQVHFRSEGAKAIMLSDMIVGNSSAGGAIGSNGSWSGVIPAMVTNIKDEEADIVRVKVVYPGMDSQLESHWARVASVGAGASGGGIHWLPQVNDEVLVAFENGNVNRPYVIGGLWNGSDKPPQPIADTLKSDKVNLRTIKTPAGNIIRMTDAAGEEKIEIIDAKQGNKVVMDGANKTLTIECGGDITFKATGKFTIEGKGIEIKSGATLNVEASGAATLKGSTVAVN